MGLLDFFRGKKNKAGQKQTLTDSDTMGIIRKLGGDSQNGYWKGFKIRKPDQAAAIEKICGRNMENISWLCQDAKPTAEEVYNEFLREARKLMHYKE